MKHILKRMISLSMVVIIAMTALVGCAGKDTAAIAETEAVVVGRYLEEEIPLPEDTLKILAMREMEDKNLRVAVFCREEIGIFDSSDLGVTWNKVMDFPTEFYDSKKQTNAERFVLMPDGNAVGLVNDYSEMIADQKESCI